MTNIVKLFTVMTYDIDREWKDIIVLIILYHIAIRVKYSQQVHMATVTGRGRQRDHLYVQEYVWV